MRQRTDRFFLASVFVLVIFGLMALTSASAPLGFAKFNDSYFFIKKQLLFGLAPGVLLFFLLAHARYEIWKKLAWLVYAFSIILLLLVFIPGVGLVINGAHSWLGIFGYTFQPAEFAKLAMIIMLAGLLAEPRKDYADFKTGLLPILAVIAPIPLLILLQPDVGTLSIVAVIIFGMLFAGGIRRAHLFVLGVVAVLGLVALLVAAPYRATRLTTFLHPELDPKGVGYQTNQAHLAIGSGGWWGLGLGHSRQKFQYLPEVHADSIFAIIGEEMGFIATTIFVVLLAVIGLKGLKIAQRAPDPFGRLLVSGIMVWFMWQSFLNIGGMVGLLPITGVPLPFVSSGGSALVVALAAMGIVASVSRNS
ncbi:putative lipid II flippase FtsW [Patescibacteria group bacterium]|nr:MAG: putative lipid II flippase FtsW [Patescibacteria group bacterium]